MEIKEIGDYMECIITVVVPVYNAEKFLNECLNSILNQTFQSYEVIAINDGSLDNSVSILMEFQEKYENLIVIDKENEGVSATRNLGIKKAKGEYILFIDSDDYIELNMLEKMYQQVIAHRAEIVTAKIAIEDEMGNWRSLIKYDYNEDKSINSNESLKLLWAGVISGHVCNKLIKKDLFLLNNIEFPVGLLYEDTPIIIKLFTCIQRQAFVNKELYHYVQRENSITKINSLKAINDQLQAIDLVENKYSYKIESSSKEYQIFLVNQLYYNYSLRKGMDHSLIDRKEYKNYEKKFKGYLSKVRWINLICNKHFSNKEKIKLLLLKIKKF